MVAFILAAGLSVVMLVAIGLNKTYAQVAVKEARRQARRGDETARRLFRPLSYGVDLFALLWAVILASAAGSFVLYTAAVPGWLAFVVIGMMMAVGFWWLPAAPVSSLGGRLAVWLAPGLASVLYYTDPIWRTISRYGSGKATLPAGRLYEKDDLYELLEWQKQQPDNRIPEAEIESAAQVLRFNDLIVADVTVAKQKLRFVSADDAIGPIMIDELHKSGQDVCLVYAGKKDNVVGYLNLDDLIQLQHGGMVADAMRSDMVYVHQNYSLYQVWQAFMKTKRHTFLVINDFEELVGVTTVEAILKQLIGDLAPGEFDQYDDRQAVAASMPVLEPVPAEEDIVEEEPLATEEQPTDN